jgi:TPR repeat protein
MFRLAADQGNAEGQFNSAICSLRHIESDADRTEITRYLKQSADQGIEIGSVNYGACLFGGFGVLVDLQEAARYFGKASRQADARGPFNYGVCSLESRRFSMNDEQLLNVLKIWRRNMMLVVL